MNLLSLPEYVIKRRRPHGSEIWEKAKRQRILSGLPIEEEMQKEKSQGIHD